MDFTAVWKVFLSLVDGGKIFGILLFIVLDWIGGVLVAIKEKTFEFSKLADYLETNVLYLFGGYLMLGAGVAISVTSMPIFKPYIEPLVATSFGALSIALLAMFVSKLKKLGIPIPDLPWQKPPATTPPA